MSVPVREDLKPATVALLEFWTSWCLYSRLLKPKMAYLAERYKGRVEVRRIDAENDKELTELYGIEFVPAMLLLDRGQVAEKWYGDTPVRALTEALDRHVQQP